ncbi:MAG: purine-nucleoside phosphorylase [Anaerolineaceae bacterium]
MSTHIGAKPDDIAEGILLPGDPLRAKFIADNFFEKTTCFNTVRNMLGFTGFYKGKRVSTMGTGMGIPSISIYINELMKDYGVKTLIRVGTCGPMQSNLKLKDVIIAQGACTNNDFNRRVFNASYCPVANFELLRAAYLNTKNVGFNVHIGNVISGDLFYADKTPQFKMWQKYGVLAGEMETAALYTFAKKYDARALAMVTVVETEGEEMSADEREKSLGNMIMLALDTIIEFM